MTREIAHAKRDRTQLRCDASDAEKEGKEETVHSLMGEFAESYDTLIAATETLHICVQTEEAARRIVEKGRQGLLVRYAEDIKKLGANEAAREAAMREELHMEYAHLEEEARDTVLARNAVAIAQIEVDSLRAQLRCFEVIAALEGSERH